MLSEIMCRRIFQQQRQQDEKVAQLKETAIRKTHGWSKKTGGGGWPRGRHHHHPHHHQQQQHPPRHHHWRPRAQTAMSLRPVNVKGNRARGMRAPKNTNQFLMHEKYQMLHMRSDSVGSDSSCSSDSDAELTDMDSYLGVLENARGGLLESPDPPQVQLRGCSAVFEEESMQYFPSEQDLLQSQNFMLRDFVEFCDFLLT